MLSQEFDIDERRDNCLFITLQLSQRLICILHQLTVVLIT